MDSEVTVVEVVKTLWEPVLHLAGVIMYLTYWTLWISLTVIVISTKLCVWLFQLSLSKLMENLNQANPFFIRCIKSNIDKVSSAFIS